ncbi:flagellar basal body P-ring formation chaperone FlgA [uncultured Tateyamaria sp.]|uniref:flagellar basal body P-ring formation chaperone FlgA n=1 Tax=uncultured Tateyamaria sp. TaxID=455651 RepID=UPI002620F48D|nr:flagellar basal body P-ring formation chaperone FlgA [uncultured Tateyamaria sp.]
MRWFFILMLMATGSYADTVMPTRTLRPGTLITASDLTVRDGVHPGMFDRVSDVVGQEARMALYAGRPIPFDAIGAPAIVNRNQIVPLFFDAGGLSITTEGRALERGGVGDRVRVMNLSSRATLFGFVQEDGSIKVTR